MPEQRRPARLFFDSGVIIEGCLGNWGTSKAVLILATMRGTYTVVLAEAVEREVQRNVARKTASLEAEQARDIARNVSGWFDRVRVERFPLPTADDIRAHAPNILPALRHVNDLPAVVTALQARPDWVLSTNTEHWNAHVAARTGLRIATPWAFLQQLRPADQR